MRGAHVIVRSGHLRGLWCRELLLQGQTLRVGPTPGPLQTQDRLQDTGTGPLGVSPPVPLLTPAGRAMAGGVWGPIGLA